MKLAAYVALAILMSTKSKIEAITNGAPVAIVILNQTGESTFASDDMKAISGYESRELIGRISFDLLSAQSVYRVKHQ